jgi:uncharacterized protein with PIN domain
MSRIAKAFDRRFRQLLGDFGATKRDKGVTLLFTKAEQLRPRKGLTMSQSLAHVNTRLATQLHWFQKRTGRSPEFDRGAPIFCDAGLGGLSRWLRASGCEAIWVQDIGDEELVERALRLGAIIITTDSFLLDRRPITQGQVKALWVPPSLTRFDQLRLVLAELDIEPEPSRCMKCGGELVEVEKGLVKDRIPPKTLRWVDQYFQCKQCGQLFWHGTHWHNIQKRLEGLEGLTS